MLLRTVSFVADVTPPRIMLGLSNADSEPALKTTLPSKTMWSRWSPPSA